MEINLTHGDPVLLADQVLFQAHYPEVALNHGMFATFMAKPMRDQPGSAMHIHQSVLDLRTGKTYSVTGKARPAGVLCILLAAARNTCHRHCR